LAARGNTPPPAQIGLLCWSSRGDRGDAFGRADTPAAVGGFRERVADECREPVAHTPRQLGAQRVVLRFGDVADRLHARELRIRPPVLRTADAGDDLVAIGAAAIGTLVAGLLRSI